jgi:hypothetical protein
MPRSKLLLMKLIVLITLFFIIDNVISFLLLKGINKYYGIGSNSEILINGSSMTMAGFNKEEMEFILNKEISIYARNGCGVEERYEMLVHYFNKDNGRTKTVLYETNPLLFSNKKTAANTYKLFFPFMDDPFVNDYIKSEASLSDYLVHKLIKTSRFDETLFINALKGYISSHENVKNIVVDINTILPLEKQKNTLHIEYDSIKVEIFKKSIQLIHNIGAEVILVNMPMTRQKGETFKHTEYQQYLFFLEQFSNEHPNVSLINLNTDLFNDYHLFSDPLHLNASGQKKLTEILSKEIK